MAMVFFIEITSFLVIFSNLSVCFLTSEEDAEIDFLRKYFTNDELDR